MCSSCAEILDQRIIGINSTQSICRQGDRIIVIDGYAGVRNRSENCFLK